MRPLFFLHQENMPTDAISAAKKNAKVQVKKKNIFLILLKKIGCGYTLELQHP